MIGRILRFIGVMLLGGLLTALAGAVVFVNNQPDLEVWHKAKLTEEFTAGSPLVSFAEYLALEDRLFVQLDALVYDRVGEADKRVFNRFHRDSPSYPGRFARNWNRSYEFSVDEPVMGALLLHGMSDAPYSLRSQAEVLHAAGAWVTGLRIPGHGTAPSGLTDATWQDMAAAVQLAMVHVKEAVGDRPVVIVGYSNGGALGVHYALKALTDNTLPMPAKIVLISPAIGVTPFAALAVWQERIGDLLGLEKLEWNSVNVEINPFKYESFAVNAGNQTHRLTAEIARLLDQLGAAGALTGFPPVLAFQSAVDATVSPPALITGLMDKLPENGHELVGFDINRQAEIEYLLTEDPRERLRPLIATRKLPFTLRVVTNESDDSPELLVRRYPPFTMQPDEQPLGARWPSEVFSLSHVALPFPPDDPLYGRGGDKQRDHVEIGQAAFRGERGVLVVSASDMLRLNWNPFHAWQQAHMLEFLGLEPPPQ
ncbi:MAG: alpha/beta fold hydrolase [Gammaproteobacteria bacterium]|nr:alpha/beta fold hydrolase [Gammaproteobacteria bacterium]